MFINVQSSPLKKLFTVPEYSSSLAKGFRSTPLLMESGLDRKASASEDAE